MRPSADGSSPFKYKATQWHCSFEPDGGLGTIGYARLIEANRGVVLLVVRTSAGDVATANGDFYDAVIDDRGRPRPRRPRRGGRRRRHPTERRHVGLGLWARPSTSHRSSP